MSCCNDMKASGRAEAFEFLAKQLRVYAGDNVEINRRYGVKSKLEKAVAAKRSQTFRDVADDCQAYATKARSEMER